MQALINFFSVDAFNSVVLFLMFGFIGLVWLFVAELQCVYQRFSALFNEDLRKANGYNWGTVAWMPIRLYVLIVIPQAIYVFFTEALKVS